MSSSLSLSLCVDSLRTVATDRQDDFDTLRPLCYPQTNVFLLCFSVVCPTSFHNIQEKWLPEIRRYGNKAPIILVGTQCDLRHDVKVLIELAQCHEQPVNSEVARRVANKIGAVKYVECSALTQKNLKEVFDTSILTGIEYEQQLLQKSSVKNTPNILVSWGKAKGKKWLKSGCNFTTGAVADHHHHCHSACCSSSGCSSSASTTSSSASSYSCSDTSLPPPIPYPRKESTATTTAGSHVASHTPPGALHPCQPLFCQHSSKCHKMSNNSHKNRLRKGWRRFCCGL
ncbi:unnamed protein product [Oppiella nova]|uniref:Uncharacterized protein n=1 Tax=Oppiella nova TaxID=334625 RepID=A0A7R9LBU4_9ACAR|nr:unnamed protein product [Oppiella nova]CAG2161824.1 unnamed protein product [Oppiella nova]